MVSLLTELGFVALPVKLAAAVVVITLAYALVSERAKLWFFSRARYDEMFNAS